ncbi:hypothetical protein Tco_1193712 [Tanacetum coccineum]
MTNTLSMCGEDFGKRFVPQTELSAKQAFWLKSSLSSEEPSTSSTLVKTNVPKELPKCLLDEIIEVQTVFNQMEGDVEQCRLKTKSSKIKMKQVLNEKDRLLTQIISQDIVNIVVNSSVDINDSMNVNVNSMEMCNKCLKLEAELIKQHNMVVKDEYNKLSKSYSQHEQHYISLELAMQLNKEIFQKNNTPVNQTEPTFDQLFEVNNLKAQLQEKDMNIKKLRAHIKRVTEISTSDSVKTDIDEIETINIELEHKASKLISENKNLKQTYK